MEAGSVIRVEDHFGLVRKWALRFGAKGPLEDTVQYADGILGLMRAVETFDAGRGKFATHASWWIKNAILSGYYEFGTVAMQAFSNLSRNCRTGSAEYTTTRLFIVARHISVTSGPSYGAWGR